MAVSGENPDKRGIRSRIELGEEGADILISHKIFKAHFKKECPAVIQNESRWCLK